MRSEIKTMIKFEPNNEERETLVRASEILEKARDKFIVCKMREYRELADMCIKLIQDIEFCREIIEYK